ncbi:hypothetical protein DEU56DRAFT_932629 [Suillus clintonianus]|uniref:uncharacterized protein n=1 Tax=Suillus clintonianus TaxID=1904413 RepID=UPI001B863A04|nr:uncharacterized protein DEU56DRAFT_932629 [Suillus clintonianus]KAG2115640.1 hypothetical protein DEU56DRAFT_932629 [Suillus clintonianus]
MPNSRSNGTTDESRSSRVEVASPTSPRYKAPPSCDNFIADDGVEMSVPEPESDSSPGEVPSNTLKHRIWPDRSTQTLYNSWSTLIPTLVEAQLQYSARTHGKPLERIQKVVSACRTLRSIELPLFFPSPSPYPPGLFPTAPSQPRMAVSLELLSFYRTLFERSCDAINALTYALKTYYSRRGFRLTDSKGDEIREPFRRGLGHAVQWYDILQIEVERQIEDLLERCRDQVTRFEDASPIVDSHSHSTSSPSCNPAISHDIDPPSTPFPSVLPQGRCLSILAQRCPACFGGIFHGKLIEEGADIHVATDGKLPSTGIGASAGFVDEARNPLVPDEAIDLCEGAYEAADGKKQKAAMDNSPGEQQKYSIALLQHLFSLLPPQATVTLLYDVGCVLARSLSKHEILPEDVTNRLRFATTAMHAYGHEWACKRLWSRFVRLIGVERSSSRQRRLWLLDRQAAAIGQEMRIDLGDWIKRRLRRGIKDQGAVAQETLTKCRIPIEELRSQWLHQQKSQLSIRTHAPARLKKELDIVLSLQTDLDTSHKALQAAKSILGKESASDDTIQALESLTNGHDRLITKVETLYVSLNIHDRFPELQGIDLEFVRILLTARDLKMNIRKRAIASFFEWDKLDRAVGGAQQALGTKLHQQTRKAIAKRQPALMTAIRKFNSYCEQLESHYDISSGIPLPSPLPTKLADLRADPTLMEDVWITPSVGEVPRWLEDSEVRDGIRALLKRDHCQEERLRLRTEADNLCRFFRAELAALELAIRSSGSDHFTAALQQRQSNFLQTQSRWTNPLASSAQFTAQVNKAQQTVLGISGDSRHPSIASIHTTTLESSDLEGDDDRTFTDEVLHVDSDQAALADLLEGDMGPLDHDDANDTTNFGHNVDVNFLQPDGSENLLIDDYNVPARKSNIVVPGTFTARVRPPCDGFPHQIFEPKDIAILCSPAACLNDICINSCAVLLYSELKVPNVSCAILSTHDLPRIRYNAPDEVIWRQCSWTQYWERDIWVLPIHRPSHVGHWVFCAIYLPSKEFHLFDSLGDQKPWKRDVKDIMKLVGRLILLARKHHHHLPVDLEGWVARPLNIQPLQTNSYDCGIWVLAAIVAVLRGRHVTGVREADIGDLRHYLSMLVLSLPLDVQQMS